MNGYRYWEGTQVAVITGRSVFVVRRMKSGMTISIVMQRSRNAADG